MFILSMYSTGGKGIVLGLGRSRLTVAPCKSEFSATSTNDGHLFFLLSEEFKTRRCAAKSCRLFFVFWGSVIHRSEWIMSHDQSDTYIFPIYEQSQQCRQLIDSILLIAPY